MTMSINFLKELVDKYFSAYLNSFPKEYFFPPFQNIGPNLLN